MDLRSINQLEILQVESVQCGILMGRRVCAGIPCFPFYLYYFLELLIVVMSTYMNTSTLAVTTGAVRRLLGVD